MSTAKWKRPHNLEDAAAEQYEKIMDDEGFDSQFDAYLSGVMWTALVAEGRIDIEPKDDDEESSEDDDD